MEYHGIHVEIQRFATKKSWFPSWRSETNISFGHKIATELYDFDIIHTKDIDPGLPSK